MTKNKTKKKLRNVTRSVLSFAFMQIVEITNCSNFFSGIIVISNVDTKRRTSKANVYSDTPPFSLPFSLLSFANIFVVQGTKTK